MEFNPNNLGFFHPYGYDATHESHDEQHGHNTAHSSGVAAQSSPLTGQLSGLNVGSRRSNARGAPQAPRTARLDGSTRFAPPSGLHGEGFQSMRYASDYMFRMDSAPPSNVSVYEIPNTPSEEEGAHHPLLSAVDRNRPSGSGGLLRSLGRRLALGRSSSSSEQPVAQPPVAHDAPVEREPSARPSGDVQASSVANAEGGSSSQLPAHYAQIMSVMPEYGQGVRLPKLQQKLEATGSTVILSKYLLASGGLQPKGKGFRKRLPSPDRRRFDAAVNARAALGPRPAHYDEIMNDSFLGSLAIGVRLSDLARNHTPIAQQYFFKADGSLHPNGQRFRRLLGADDRARFDRARKRRQNLSEAFNRIGRNRFKQVAHSLAIAGERGRVDDAAAEAGVELSDIRLFLTDEGLTPAGKVWVPQLEGRTAASVQADLDRWNQLRSRQQAAQPSEAASPAASFPDFAIPGAHEDDVGSSAQYYDQQAIWESFSPLQHPEAPSHPPPFADFPAPGAYEDDIGSSAQYYDQHAIWESLAPQASQPPVIHDAPVERERERSARWDDVQASNSVADDPYATRQLPAHYAEIMSVLPEYEQGVPIPVLQTKLKAAGSSFELGSYLAASGGLNTNGISFRTLLTSPDRDRLDAATALRAALPSPTPAHYDDIMQDSFLDDFGIGVRLMEMDKKYGGTFVNKYFRSDGSLQLPGQRFHKQLPDEDDQARLDAACDRRRKLYDAFKRIGRSGFKKVANSLGAQGRVDNAAEQAGKDVKDIRLFLTEAGLTPAGKVWLHQLDKATRASVQAAHDHLTQRRPQQRAAQPPESASPAASFFDFPVPGTYESDVGTSEQYYDQQAIWESLAPPHTTGYADPHAAGPSSSSQPVSDDQWEERSAQQARRFGIPVFGADVIGREWHGAPFVDYRGHSFYYAPSQLAAPLAALLARGEIEAGSIVNIRGANYTVAPIGSASPRHDPHGLTFMLYPM